MRYVVIAMLIAIVVSLVSAFWYMLHPSGKDPKRMVKALAVRVGLSVTLFVLLMAGYYFGLIGARL